VAETGLTPADDSLHAPGSAERWWTETHWFGFDVPGPDVSVTVYPLFRPNLGVCSLSVFAWDAREHAPHRVRYARHFWHLAMPTMDVTALRLEGLSYDCLEPLKAWHVRYEDGDRLQLDVEFRALVEPHAPSTRPEGGHFDQPSRVTGELALDGERIVVDCFGMRDKSWSRRPDTASGRGTAYTYGTVSAAEHFLALTTLDGNEGTAVGGPYSGYLVRDGVRSGLVSATRRVTARRGGYPVRIELDGEDKLGRTFRAAGTTRNRLANPATPAQFAWMSMTAWDMGRGVTAWGEDQEVWNPDLLGDRLLALSTEANR